MHQQHQYQQQQQQQHKSFSTIVPEHSTTSVGIDSRILMSAPRDPPAGSTRKNRVLFKPEPPGAGPTRTTKTSAGPTQKKGGDASGPSSASGSTDVAVEEDMGGVQEILELLCILGSGLLHLGQFRSKESIEMFERLPEEHFHTGWVLHQVGRAHFEMADYQGAIRYLQIMEQLEPHRMKGLEVLSTALWQTKREVELSHLAQRVVDFDRFSAEVWCVVGNCFSLQKEHETALTFFRRSIQLNPSFTYSHTLSGHEYFANEDFSKAIACYRDAIRADERHYNAWYGLGAVYYRQEKFDLAEYHFQKACQINPQSSVLICHLGMAQNANGKPYEALETLSMAFRIQPQNPQAHYQRSMVYQTLDRQQEALADLEKVRNAANDMGLAIRGFHGAGSDAAGDLYQISNQTTLGKSESVLLGELCDDILPNVIGYERRARQQLLENRRPFLEDLVHRALGVLLHARLLTAEEAMQQLSLVRLGVDLGLVAGEDEAAKARVRGSVHELFVLSQPAHLQQSIGEALEQDRRRAVRATLVRDRRASALGVG